MLESIIEESVGKSYDIQPDLMTTIEVTLVSVLCPQLFTIYIFAYAVIKLANRQVSKL